MLDFVVPKELEASEPPEARGMKRDQVRLMISYRADNRIVHAQFRDLARFLDPGDLLVINTSGTMPAALDAVRSDGAKLELHLSTHLPSGLWIVELRQPAERATKPYYDVVPGEILHVPAGGTISIHAPYNVNAKRLWLAELKLPCSLNEYLAQYGIPIRYEYVKQPWDISYYQTVYVTQVGSAEMPSAGRPFTPELITRLVAKGVQIAPLLLHTGVASLEGNEPPYEEYYCVPADTARAVNNTHDAGKRVIAVGTTVVRALETMTDVKGVVRGGEGWTRLIVTPERGIRAVDAMITGMHEPRAKHLDMLAALAGAEHLENAYHEGVREKYLWHEFGDLHLIL
jgi:S-adenosylmethionine:tRNA ribosyltransferase-isomerase